MTTSFVSGSRRMQLLCDLIASLPPASRLSEDCHNRKDRIRIVPLEVMVTSPVASFYMTALLSSAYRILEAMCRILHAASSERPKNGWALVDYLRGCLHTPVVGIHCAVSYFENCVA